MIPKKPEGFSRSCLPVSTSTIQLQQNREFSSRFFFALPPILSRHISKLPVPFVVLLDKLSHGICGEDMTFDNAAFVIIKVEHIKQTANGIGLKPWQRVTSFQPLKCSGIAQYTSGNIRNFEPELNSLDSKKSSKNRIRDRKPTLHHLSIEIIDFQSEELIQHIKGIEALFPSFLADDSFKRSYGKARPLGQRMDAFGIGVLLHLLNNRCFHSVQSYLTMRPRREENNTACEIMVGKT